MPRAKSTKQQYRARRLAEKFGLTTGEARLVLAASGKDRSTAKSIAIELSQLQRA
jgi:hypothetical protein